MSRIYCNGVFDLCHIGQVVVGFHSDADVVTYKRYPISITNDQGIIALYFTNIKPLFKQIKTHNEILYFYDYLSRNKNNKYIILKSI